MNRHFFRRRRFGRIPTILLCIALGNAAVVAGMASQAWEPPRRPGFLGYHPHQESHEQASRWPPPASGTSDTTFAPTTATSATPDAATSSSTLPANPTSTQPAPSTPAKGTSASPAATPDAAMPYPKHPIAVYYGLWDGQGVPTLSTVPPQVNVLNLAFAAGDPPRLVGTAGRSQDVLISDVQRLRQRGVRIIISIGGEGETVTVAHKEAFVQGIMDINRVIPLDGLDWDLEGPALTASDVVWISSQLRRLRGPSFAITMAPTEATWRSTCRWVSLCIGKGC